MQHEGKQVDMMFTQHERCGAQSHLTLRAPMRGSKAARVVKTKERRNPSVFEDFFCTYAIKYVPLEYYTYTRQY